MNESPQEQNTISTSLNVNSDLIEKQNLIKSTIIENNYDKNLFFTYCMNREGSKGDDLSNWTIEELKEVINSFRKEQDEKILHQNTKEKEYKENQNMVESLQLNMDKIQNQKGIEYNTSPYIQEIKCKVLEKSIINDKNIKVIVRNPKPIETGFFTSNYIIYEVFTEITPELNWSVNRRYSDFIWLRQTLRVHFPRLFVPPIPGKKFGSRRFEIDFIEKRMHFLNEFLNNLISSETFKASEPLIAFLSLFDRNQFEMKMKELSSYVPTNYIEDVKTITGKIYISNSEPNNEKYYTNITNYFKIQEQLFDRLNYNLKNFYTQMNEAVVSLEDVQKDFELLHLLNSRVQIREEIVKSYEKLAVFFKNWKRMMFNQNEIIKTHIKDFFKYIRMEGMAYTELIDSREIIKNQFINENNRLTAKKTKLWSTMDITKWEITEDIEKIDRILLMRDKDYACSKMCTQETQVCENLRRQFGYANRNNIDELKRLINKYCESYLQNLKDFSDKLYPSIGDGLNIWSTIASISDK